MRRFLFLLVFPLTALAETLPATPTPASPDALRTQIADEVKRWAGVVEDAGIKAE